MKGNVTLVKVDEMYNVLKSILPSGAYATLYMRDCSHYEMRENKPHLSCGFP